MLHFLLRQRKQDPAIHTVFKARLRQSNALQVLRERQMAQEIRAPPNASASPKSELKATARHVSTQGVFFLQVLQETIREWTSANQLVD